MRVSPAGRTPAEPRHGSRLGASSEPKPTGPVTAHSVGLKNATVLSRTQKHRSLTNEQIARQLVLSPDTAKTHVSRTMIKLGARDRAQLVVIAYQSGLVTPGDNQRS